MDSNQEFSLYKDMKARTNGEIYIGVVGPVRTGKSTFIKRFMDLCVLPQMENEHVRARAKDELPQSAAGTTIMTTEPKFIPSEAALIYPMEDVGVIPVFFFTNNWAMRKDLSIAPRADGYTLAFYVSQK